MSSFRRTPVPKRNPFLALDRPQLPCSLDFACNSRKLKDLAHSRKTGRLFSRFCRQMGEGGVRYQTVNTFPFWKFQAQLALLAPRVFSCGTPVRVFSTNSEQSCSFCNGGRILSASTLAPRCSARVMTRSAF